MISLIVAMDRNRLIGVNNQLPWRLSADLKRFKSITLGKPVIMGRKTFESIGKPLVERRNIIITRNVEYSAEGCEIVSSIEQAMDAVNAIAEVMIIGGVTIYQQAMPYVQRMYLTVINHAFEGDAWFPEFDGNDWDEIESETLNQDPQVNFTYRFVTLQRKC